MRLVLVALVVAALIVACGSDADKPLHRQAVDAFRDWADSFETAEYSTTALGVGERPTGEFDFEGEARYRKDPESVWTILYLGDANAQDERESFQQLRVEDEEFIWDFGFWRHVGSGDDSGSIALENELRSMLGTPIITDDRGPGRLARVRGTVLRWGQPGTVARTTRLGHPLPRSRRD